jgi:hypothetical protein
MIRTLVLAAVPPTVPEPPKWNSSVFHCYSIGVIIVT